MATYKINIRRYWYGPRETIMPYYDPETGRVWTGTRAAARAIIDAAESTSYYLAHNESGRPTYRIAVVRETDGT